MKHDRQKEILDIFKFKQALTIKDLARTFNVSEITVRRDLNELANKNYLHLIPGGAIYNDASLSTQNINTDDYSLASEESRQIPEKRRIAKKAASLIAPGETILIDSGSTTEFLSDEIPAELPLTVICYAFNILIGVYKRSNCAIVFGGGVLHNNIMMFESEESVSTIKKYRVNHGFFSAGGISSTLGVTTASQYELGNKRAALESSYDKVLLADSTKFDNICAVHYADLTDFTTIITDVNLDPKYKSYIEGLGITLHLV